MFPYPDFVSARTGTRIPGVAAVGLTVLLATVALLGPVGCAGSKAPKPPPAAVVEADRGARQAAGWQAGENGAGPAGAYSAGESQPIHQPLA